MYVHERVCDRVCIMCVRERECVCVCVWGEREMSVCERLGQVTVRARARVAIGRLR